MTQLRGASDKEDGEERQSSTTELSLDAAPDEDVRCTVVVEPTRKTTRNEVVTGILH